MEAAASLKPTGRTIPWYRIPAEVLYPDSLTGQFKFRERRIWFLFPFCWWPKTPRTNLALHIRGVSR